MRPILIFSPYIIVPLLVSLVFKKANGWIVYLTFALTGVLMFLYPFLCFMVDDYLNPPPPGPRCGNPEMGFFIGNIILLIPISLGFQGLFNYLFGLYKINKK